MTKKQTVNKLQNISCNKELRKHTTLYYFTRKYKLLDAFKKRVNQEETKKFEDCIRKCKSITEFRQKYPKYIHRIWKEKGKYKSWFIKQKFSRPQLICKQILESIVKHECLYNDRKTLKGRELDVYSVKYKIACEYNSYYWHREHRDLAERDNEKLELCKQKGIILINIVERSNQRHSDIQTAFNDIKKQFKQNLYMINAKLPYDITVYDINKILIDNNELYSYMYNEESIIEKLNECNTYAEFRQKYTHIYQYIFNNNLHHLMDIIKCKDHRHMTKQQYFVYIKSECKTYSDLIKHKTYPFAYARGYTKDLKKILS